MTNNQPTLFDTSVCARALHWSEWEYRECLAAEIDSVTLPIAVAESTSPPHLVDSVTELEAVTESTPTPGIDSVTRSVAPYWPRGTASGGRYFRFSYSNRLGG